MSKVRRGKVVIQESGKGDIGSEATYRNERGRAVLGSRLWVQVRGVGVTNFHIIFMFILLCPNLNG